MTLFAIRWIYVALGVFGFFAVLAFIRIVWTKTCILHHRQRRYIAMDLHGRKNAQNIAIPFCYCWATAQDKLGNLLPSHSHRFLMRWFCDACGSMGEHCWDKRGEWKLEHGQIVPDEKRWAQRG